MKILEKISDFIAEHYYKVLTFFIIVPVSISTTILVTCIARNRSDDYIEIMYFEERVDVNVKIRDLAEQYHFDYKGSVYGHDIKINNDEVTIYSADATFPFYDRSCITYDIVKENGSVSLELAHFGQDSLIAILQFIPITAISAGFGFVLFALLALLLIATIVPYYRKNINGVRAE